MLGSEEFDGGCGRKVEEGKVLWDLGNLCSVLDFSLTIAFYLKYLPSPFPLFFSISKASSKSTSSFSLTVTLPLRFLGIFLEKEKRCLSIENAANLCTLSLLLALTFSPTDK